VGVGIVFILDPRYPYPIWSFIQLIQNEHVLFEHISFQLDAGASAPRKSIKTKALQMRECG
jgi:hypothetical protein